jgi:uncharacterized protein (TIGR02145 family)
MKRNLLLIMMCVPVILEAQNGVTVSNLVVNAGTVTFNVSWNADAMPVTLWSDTVWVFVDYNNRGRMERLPVTDATVSAGSVIKISGNDKGVWVVGNARSAGSFSASVKLLTAVATINGACAYASNYPPVGEYTTATHISFTGTPMYEISLTHSGGDSETVKSGNTFLLPCGYTMSSFSDATGAPGIMKCIAPATYTLLASASGFCAGSAGVQFALDDTEGGRGYQLFRNNSAVNNAVLDGDGSAATFTGSFNEAGTYTVRTIADDLYCAIAMNGTHVVVENPLPGNPAVNDASRNCPGTVTLSASSSGAVIDWYANVDAATSLYSGASYTTPEIETSTTYYVQAKIEETNCLSARVPVLAEVITEGCCHEPGSTVTFTAFNPCAGAPYGSTYTLIDDRDDKFYKVRYMPDERYWMVQDLKFGSNCEKTSFNYTGTATVTTLVDVSGLYYGDCRKNTASDGGYYYSRAAALSKNFVYNNSTNAMCEGTSAGQEANAPSTCRGICPEQWHVPTAAEYERAMPLWTTYTGAAKATVYRSAGWFAGIAQGVMVGSSPGYTGEVWYTTSAASGSYGENNGVCCSYRAGREGFPLRCLRNY